MRYELKVPSVGESISEVEIGDWKKASGDSIRKDEALVVLESEKATVDLPSPVSGVLAEVLKKKGETARVGEAIAWLDDSSTPPKAGAAAPESAAPESPQPSGAPPPPDGQPRVMPAAQRVLAEKGLRAEAVPATGPGGRLLKEDVLRHVESAPAAAQAQVPRASAATETPPANTVAPAETPAVPPVPTAAPVIRGEEAVRISRLRRTVAERLVRAQQNAALLTTFNEIDMSAVMALRKQFGEAWLHVFLCAGND
jgi:2-oxoglutarate dehydrogenase E2 component (dihydrolipoamide succinyltransferase)